MIIVIIIIIFLSFRFIHKTNFFFSLAIEEQLKRNQSGTRRKKTQKNFHEQSLIPPWHGMTALAAVFRLSAHFRQMYLVKTMQIENQ